MGGTGALGGGDGTTTDTVAVRPRAGAACGRVTRRAERAARRVTGARFALRARVLAREVRERAGELVFLDTGRFAFFETAPSKGIAASQIQSTQDINPPVVPTEWWARWATQVVEAEAALRAQWA